MVDRIGVMRSVLMGAFSRLGRSPESIASSLGVRAELIHSILNDKPMSVSDVEAVALAAGLFYACDLTKEDLDHE